MKSKTKATKAAKIAPRPVYVHVPYLTATDEGAFLGMEVKPRHHERHPDYPVDYDVKCPGCMGYGGWHLRIDAYGPGKHFDCFCDQCYGYGWVAKDSPNATCVHEKFELSQEECYKRGITHYGRCWHTTECKKCGHVSGYDSSD